MRDCPTLPIDRRRVEPATAARPGAVEPATEAAAGRFAPGAAGDAPARAA